MKYKDITTTEEEVIKYLVDAGFEVCEEGLTMKEQMDKIIQGRHEMTEEKQIEGMQLIMLNTFDPVYSSTDMVKANADTRYLAEAKSLYDNGYRRQSEGEWQLIDYQGVVSVRCTRCKADRAIPTFWTFADVVKYDRYCPKCGAHMKEDEI